MYKVLCCCRPTRIGQSQITEICLEKQDHQTINGGMNLYSTNGTHYLLDVAGSESFLVQNFALKDKDKLLGINYKATECFSHDKVLDMLRSSVSSPLDNSINLVIERQNGNDQTIIVEIDIEITGIFVLNEYLGRSSSAGRFGGIVYMVAFKCATSDYYIEAKMEDRGPQLELVRHRRPPRDDQQDARFFLLTKTDTGYSMFESLLFRGRYWTSMASTYSTQLQSFSAEDSLQLQRHVRTNDSTKHWFTILPEP